MIGDCMAGEMGYPRRLQERSNSVSCRRRSEPCRSGGVAQTVHVSSLCLRELQSWEVRGIVDAQYQRAARNGTDFLARIAVGHATAGFGQDLGGGGVRRDDPIQHRSSAPPGWLAV